MAQLKHNNGIVEVVIELGFDLVKYFEFSATGTASSLNIGTPARRLTLRNSSESDDVYFNITGNPATTTVGPVPGDNIKLGPGCTFTMDFDVLTAISFITTGATVVVEGILGWKGTQNC